MRRTLVTTCLAIAVLASGLTIGARQASATEVGYSRKLGLGFVIGNPTGLVGKYWVGSTNAVDVGVGFYGYNWGWRGCDPNGNCQNGGLVTINSDYLWQSNIVKSNVQLDWHIGVGGRINFWGDGYRNGVEAGVRGPIGVDLMFNNPSFLEIYFEIAPVFYVVPPAWLAIEGGLGVRLYF